MNKIKKIIEKIFLAPIPNVEGDINSYIRAIESGKFKNKIVYGISDKEKGFLAYDPVKNPGALYCGSMGSGKSIAMRFSVATNIATNSENTVYLLMDPLKGMTDYAYLFDGKKMDFSKNVAHAVNDAAKIVPLIDMVYDEAMERKLLFSVFSCKNIYDVDFKLNEIYQLIKSENPSNEEELFNIIQSSSNIKDEMKNEFNTLKEEKKLYLKIMNQLLEVIKNKEEKHSGIARIMICIEEFHKIPTSPFVKFNMKVDSEGSVANKMKELMRVGRSYGIAFMFATQRGTAEDVPTSLKPGLSVMMCFKMSTPGEAGALNLPHANKITNEQRGRCAYEGGFIQYPYLDDKPLETLMKKYYKPLKSYFLKYDMDEYKTAFSGKGNSGMVKIKPFSELIKFANQFKFEDIVERLLSKFDIETKLQENKAYVAEQIGIKRKDKYAIKLIKERGDGSEKEIEALRVGAEKLGCNKILIIGVDFIPPNLSRVKDENMIVLDKDDLIQISNVFDNEEVLKDEGSYNEMYLSFALSSRSDLGLDEIEEVAQNEGKEERSLDYLEIKKNNQDLNAYVSSDLKVNNLPENLKEDFKNKREEFKKTGKLPSINDPLIDDIIDKKNKLLNKKDVINKKSNIIKKDKKSTLSIPPTNTQSLKGNYKGENKLETKTNVDDLLREKLLKLKAGIQEKEKLNEENQPVIERNTEISKVIKENNSLKDIKRKKDIVKEKKNEIKLKKGLSKESIINLRDELKKELLSTND